MTFNLLHDTLHHLLEFKYRDFGTDQLNAQKASGRHPCGSLLRPEPSRLEPFLLTVPRSSQFVTGKPHLPTIQRLAPPSHVRSGILITKDAEASAEAAAVDLRWNADHFSGAAAVDQEVLRAAEDEGGHEPGRDEAGARVAVDHHGQALGTTCLTISGIVVVAIEFSVIFLSSVRMRGHGR
ncbi:hypothetical protein H4582DRAFT_2057952 [Lactarius indigo]|nr:hypothetical protein H4582DRAFT_2057952 [Lactarius indigo]